MALLFMDGFDLADFTAKGWSSGATTTASRFGTGRSLASPGMIRFAASAQVFVGYAVQMGGYGTNFNGWRFAIHADNGTSTHLRLYFSPTVHLYRNDGTLLATGTMPSNANPINSWIYVEVSATIADSGGTCEVRVNGTTVINFTGDTRSGGTSTNIDAISQNQYDIGSIWDDLYICDGTGSAPYNTFLGEIRIHSLSPTAAGSSTQWTPDTGSNYSRVNEVPYSAANYVQSGTTGHRDTYAVADLPASVGNVLAVQNNVVAKKTDVAGISIKPAIKSGAGVYYGGTSALTVGDTTVMDLRTIDPNTSTAWTAGGVNALEGGFEVA